MKNPPTEHIVKLVCIGCEKEFDFRMKLPTAVRCEHCGMIFEARLSRRKSG